MLHAPVTRHRRARSSALARTGAVQEEGHEGLVGVGGDAVDAGLPVLTVGALQGGVLVVLQEAVVLCSADVCDLLSASGTLSEPMPVGTTHAAP